MRKIDQISVNIFMVTNRSNSNNYMEKAKKNGNLTKAEVKVLELIVAGKSNKEIAGMLSRSIRTVEGRRYRIMHKCGAANITELVKKVLASNCPKLRDVKVPKKSKTVPGSQITQNADTVTAKPFTNIEKIILKQVLDGKSSRKIAEKLNRSVRTVEEHRSHIMRKLGVDDLIGLVKSSIQMGFIEAANRKALPRKCLEKREIFKE